MGVGAIEAIVDFGKYKYTLNDILGSLTHHRGWSYPSSYVIVEIFNPHTEVVNEFMNHGLFTVKYGKDGDYSGPFTFQIASVANSIEFSAVKVRVLGVEPGFIKLAEKVMPRSYPNKTIAEVLAEMAGRAGLKHSGVKRTVGNHTFVQPNMSDMQFITKYLTPIATDSSRSAPFLFTIDNNIIHCRPPDLKQDPKFKLILDSSKENIVKRFTVKNRGLETDMLTGSEYTTYGYDFTKKGTLVHKDNISTVNQSHLNKKTYQSDFTRNRMLPYSEQWMVDAYNRNELGRAQFVVSAEMVIVGENEYNFDQIYQATNLFLENETSEYTGKYYVYSLSNTLKRRFFVSQLNVVSNAFLKGEKPSANSPQQEGPRRQLSTTT